MDELLKKYCLKVTKQRILVLNLINELQDQATINNITFKLLKSVNQSTVYRIVELFIKKNIILKELNYKNEVYYRINEEHGHYFTCVKCHKREKIDECPIENIESNIENKGYQILNHTVEINGICNNCSEV